MIFEYPLLRTERRHGPDGYQQYESYRPWLRDEFKFQCVYCLKRETWGQVTGEFELDHFEPQSINPSKKLDYLNLVYACRRCNSVKSDRVIADPFVALNNGTIELLEDGSIDASSFDSRRIIRVLDLNSPRMIQWRNMWSRIVELADQNDESLHQMLVGLPTDLPNLRRLRPKENTKPKGISESWYARASER